MALQSSNSIGISRRRWLVGAGALLAAACRRAKGTGYPGYALIATAGQKSVAAVDLTAFRVSKDIPVPGEPSSILSTPTEGAFALLGNTGTLAYIGRDLNIQKTRRIAESLNALRLLPGGKRLIAFDPDRSELLLIDGTTLSVEGRRRLHEPAASIDVSQSGDLVVTASQDGSLNLLNLRTGDWRHTHLKANLGSVVFRFDGNLVAVANIQDRVLTALRVPDLSVEAELPLAMEPRNVCFTPDGGQLFISGPGMDAVAIAFLYNMLEVEQTVLVGRDPGVMVCSADSTFLFVGSASGSDVSIMRVETRKSVGAVGIGSQPTYLTLTPDGQYALVLCGNTGDLAVIRVGAIRANRSKTGVALFTMLPVGEKPVHCAFVPKLLA